MLVLVVLGKVRLMHITPRLHRSGQRPALRRLQPPQARIPIPQRAINRRRPREPEFIRQLCLAPPDRA